MKRIIKSKYKIILIPLGLLIVLVGLIILNKVIKEELNKKIELGNSIYEKVHNLYFYGDNVEFVQDKNHIRSNIKIDNQKY